MKFAIFLLPAALLVARPAFCSDPAPIVVSEPYLEGLHAKVRAQHPAVLAAKAKTLAESEAVREVRLWEDSMAGVGVTGADKEMRRNSGDLMVSVEQALPRRRLFEARKAQARAGRSRAEAELDASVANLETMAATTAIEIALADEMLAVERSQLRWLEGMGRNAQERLIDPSGNPSEALRIGTELALGKQKLASSTLMRERLARELNILLDGSSGGDWPTLRLPAEPAATPGLETALAALPLANPTLRAMSSESEAAKAGIEIARRESDPIFSVGIDTKLYSGGDFRDAGVVAKMTIPLFNRASYRAGVERARAQHDAAQREAEAADRELRAQLARRLIEAEDASRQAATYAREIIPRAEQAAEATEAAWLSSRANVLEVFEARRAVLEAQLEQRRLIAAQGAALAMVRSILPPKTHSTTP